MKITKRQLRRIIKEEKAQVLAENTRASQEGDIQKELADIMSAIHEIATGVYNLAGGDELANDLDLQIKRVDDLLHGRLEAYFKTVDGMSNRNPTRGIG